MSIRHQRYGVQVTHRPTGYGVFVSADRIPFGAGSMVRAKRVALKIVACHVRHAEPDKPPLVRCYDLGGPCGPFMRDGRSGERSAGEDAVNAALDRGEIDRLLLAAAWANKDAPPRPPPSTLRPD